MTLTLRRRVHIFQGALLATITEAEKKASTDIEWAGIAVLTLLAQAINDAEDGGAFDDD